MKVLLVGGGGREHALGWKIAQSPRLSKLYLAPGNPGLKALGETLPVAAEDVDAIVKAAREKAVDLVVVGPETPLAAGLADRLAAADIPCFGPSAAAARLETSKAFAKEICAAAGAPTAAYGRFHEAGPARAFLRAQRAPYVIKADGLAAGKGVVIAETLAEADAAVDDFLAGRFGAASAEILIEEFMEGEEASFFALCDGERVLPLSAAQDHKRAFDGDEGPNTGGMGAYSPTPVFTDEIREQTIARIAEPVVAEMRRRGAPYRGVLYIGLMIGADGPRVVEFNARFGDPECQALMRRLESDILPALYAAAVGDLAGRTLDWSDEAAALVVLAAKGYPGAYEKGSRIRGVEAANRLPGVVVFHAGTEERDGALIAAGGRVLNVTATGATIREAVERAYAGVDAVDWPEGFCRRDIAWRALAREPGARGP
ncbi:phosphoribosylamine--glycine ligase [Amphiplicatus metriothermophilus]|uniref:Phosphoribosylamine--glycine ligase n=1 Tax=Amphiplicatus metriothermophilus TaxID=1519374 RepID=A0A239PKE3_9PROT|nr:phosphoribosylamine--glycine ligase [Amphiplicatus metriothermophilus]MBB5517399.1 phosphoribosylamine--glycine ligase [Amphiplicatus metriothermophilus]SNT68266.1 phosphoribosylamine--glycine ligase [Amphiplicatus metriothermophilus]